MRSLSISSLRWSHPGNSAFCLCVDDITISRGQAVYLAGPSGSGKSTLLNHLCGVLPSPVNGFRASVFPRVAYVMHQSSLAPWLTLCDNVRLEERLRRSQCDRGVLEALIASFQLEPAITLRLFPKELSFGMRQRFEIAKALAFTPDLLLLDEGLSGIDEVAKRAVISAVASAVDRHQTTIVFTSHNIADALRLADCVVQVKAGNFSRVISLPTARGERTELPVGELLGRKDVEFLM